MQQKCSQTVGNKLQYLHSSPLLIKYKNVAPILLTASSQFIESSAEFTEVKTSNILNGTAKGI